MDANGASVGGSGGFFVRRSTTGASGSFSTVDWYKEPNTQLVNVLYGLGCVAVSPNNGAIYAAHAFNSGTAAYYLIRRSLTGNSGTFETVDSGKGYFLSSDPLKISNDGTVYFFYNEYNNRTGSIYMKASPSGESGTFKLIDSGYFYSDGSPPGANLIYGNSFALTPSNKVVYFAYGNKFRIGKKIINSSSLGPVYFGTSYGYHKEYSFSASAEISSYGLANVSEFPHSNGIFQMKNLLLGTQDSGFVGKDENSIIQIKHIGSIVKILWPRQENADSSLRGYGDLSIGQSVGKLSTIFEPGEFFNVEDFDHMSLYCYLRKELSGTLDDIIVQIERKPIKDIGFTTEQAIAYNTSGSYAEARLRDIVYTKEINYGDLSLREIGYPIDIPLVNTKQIRISVRHKNGQIADENKNFIVYGRFIKKSKDTNET